MRISDWSSDVCSSDLRVTDTTQFGAENLERPGSGGGEPEIGYRARDHIHLGPELGHVEVVQDVYRAEQYLDRLAERQVQVVPLDDDIILPVWILRVQTHGGVGVHVPAAGRAQPPVFPREPITPLPLLHHNLPIGRASRNTYALVP